MSRMVKFEGQAYGIRDELYSTESFTVLELADEVMLKGEANRFVAITNDNRLYSIDVFETDTMELLKEDHGKAEITAVRAV